MAKEGLSLLEAILSVAVQEYPGKSGFFYPKARADLGMDPGQEEIIEMFAKKLRKRFGYEHFEAVEDKAGTYGFLLKVLDADTTSGVDVFVRFSVQEREDDKGRPLHRNVYQPFYARRIKGDMETFKMEVMVGEERRLDFGAWLIADAQLRLRKDGIPYKDYVKASNFCPSDTEDEGMVIDGGAMTIHGNKYKDYLRDNPVLSALAMSSRSFKHLRQYVPKQYRNPDNLPDLPAMSK